MTILVLDVFREAMTVEEVDEILEQTRIDAFADAVDDALDCDRDGSVERSGCDVVL